MASEKLVDEATRHTSLDLSEHEDRWLLTIAETIDAKRGTSVEARADYGNEAKLLVRHMAGREAALVDVVDGLAKVPDLQALRERLLGDPSPRRAQMNAVGKM